MQALNALFGGSPRAGELRSLSCGLIAKLLAVERPGTVLVFVVGSGLYLRRTEA